MAAPLPDKVIFPLTGKRIWVAGHRGMVGAAIVRRLEREGCEIITVTREVVDLLKPVEVERFLTEAAPDAIVLAAAKVGGILANDTYPAEFLFENLMITANVTDAAHRCGVKKMLFLGSSCIYPRMAPQPIKEEALLTGPLEATNEWYAVAKIAGIKLAQAYRKQHGRDFISVMPTNLYGPGDNFDLHSGHVVPALIRKVHEAKLSDAPYALIWGTGTPRRVFLHVDDCADACVVLMKCYSGSEHVNVGTGRDISIIDLARLVCEVVEFRGDIRTDPTKPDGTPRKLLDVMKLDTMGWRARIDLKDGLIDTYRAFLASERR